MRKIAKIILVCLLFASVTSCQDDALNEIEVNDLDDIENLTSSTTKEDDAVIPPGEAD